MKDNNNNLVNKCVAERAEKLNCLRNVFSEINNRLKRFSFDIDGGVEISNANRRSARKYYDHPFVEFWQTIDDLDKTIAYSPSSKKFEKDFKSKINWAEKFVEVIAQVCRQQKIFPLSIFSTYSILWIVLKVLFYEATLQLECLEDERIEIVSVGNNLNSFLHYRPHCCTEETCRPKFEPEFKLGENIYCLPFEHGYRRGIIKNRRGIHQVN